MSLRMGTDLPFRYHLPRSARVRKQKHASFLALSGMLLLMFNTTALFSSYLQLLHFPHLEGMVQLTLKVSPYVCFLKVEIYLI